MRPSCQSAKPWPCSAAYCSEITARFFSPVLSASVALRIASIGVIAGDSAACGDDGVPSSDRVGSTPKVSAITVALATTLNIRIARCLGSPARMGDGAVERVADLLGVFPDRAGGDVVRPRLPALAALL